jgi:hypothetical protein
VRKRAAYLKEASPARAHVHVTGIDGLTKLDRLKIEGGGIPSGVAARNMPARASISV